MISAKHNLVPCVPPSAPFTTEQRAWLNGFLAGLFATADNAAVLADSRKPVPKSLLILYGSQTRTAEALAKRIGAEAAAHNYHARVVEMSRLAELDLQKENRALIVTSTWGDGDPPDNAAAFWTYLNSTSVPPLHQLSFAVLALGDRNYANFCGAGRKFDERFEQLGARRIHPRADCDTDYEPTANAWLKELWPALDQVIEETNGTPTPEGGLAERLVHESPPMRTYSRANPFPARLVARRNLNESGSAKETQHIEFSLEGSNLNYVPGDALGVLPCNCPELVGEIVAALGCDGEEAVLDSAQEETSLRNALLRHYQIAAIPQALVEAVAGRTKDVELKRLLENKAQLDSYCYGKDVLDLLRSYRSVFGCPKELLSCLKKLQPRLYSISSSPKAHPDEVHITVGALRYESCGRKRKGVCSTFLADRLAIHATAPVYIQVSQNFRLPEDPDKAIIMIGPGTGIAPFRAFLEEREITGAKGKNWLFFGDQCHGTDFLYREQLTQMLNNGHLTRLDTAFSRDQEQKVYVQHRMLENAEQFWRWLEEGAHVYVCGDARRMAKDVDAALHEIVQKAGGKSAGQAADYVTTLKAQKRYQRDVY